MKIRIWIILPFLSALFFSACYYDNSEELYGVPECEVEEVSYNSDVLSIVQNHCYICHESSVKLGGVSLEGYSALRSFVDDGSLVGAIRHDVGYSAMPQGESQLLECDIRMIEIWIEEGALNN